MNKNNSMVQTMEVLQCEKLKEIKLQQLTHTKYAAARKERPHTARKSMHKLEQSKDSNKPITCLGDNHMAQPPINGIKKDSDDISKVWENIRKDLKEKQSKPAVNPKSTCLEDDCVIVSDDDDISFVSFCKGDKDSQQKLPQKNNFHVKEEIQDSLKPKISKPLESLKHKIDKLKDPLKNGNCSPDLSQKESEIKKSLAQCETSLTLKEDAKTSDSNQTIDLCDLDDPEDDKTANSSLNVLEKDIDKKMDDDFDQKHPSTCMEKTPSECSENKSEKISNNEPNFSKSIEDDSALKSVLHKQNIFENSQTIDLCEMEESEENAKTKSDSTINIPEVKLVEPSYDDIRKVNASDEVKENDNITLSIEKAPLETRSSLLLSKESNISEPLEKLQQPSPIEEGKYLKSSVTDEEKSIESSADECNVDSQSFKNNIILPYETSLPKTCTPSESYTLEANSPCLESSPIEASMSPQNSADSKVSLNTTNESSKITREGKKLQEDMILAIAPQETSFKPPLIREKAKLIEAVKNGASKILEARKNEKCKLKEKAHSELKSLGDFEAKTVVDDVSTPSDKSDALRNELNENVTKTEIAYDQDITMQIAEGDILPGVDKDHGPNLSQDKDTNESNKDSTGIDGAQEDTSTFASETFMAEEDDQNQGSEADPFTDEFVIIDEVKEDESEKNEPSARKRLSNITSSCSDEPHSKKIKNNADDENSQDHLKGDEDTAFSDKEDSNFVNNDSTVNALETSTPPVEAPLLQDHSQELPQSTKEINEEQNSFDQSSDHELSNNDFVVIDEIRDEDIEKNQPGERKRRETGENPLEEPQPKRLKMLPGLEDIPSNADEPMEISEDVISGVVKRLVDHTVSTVPLAPLSSQTKITGDMDETPRDRSISTPQAAVNVDPTKVSLSEIRFDFEDEDEDPFPDLQIVDSVIEMDLSRTSSPQPFSKKDDDFVIIKNSKPNETNHSAQIDTSNENISQISPEISSENKSSEMTEKGITNATPTEILVLSENDLKTDESNKEKLENIIKIGPSDKEQLSHKEQTDCEIFKSSNEIKSNSFNESDHAKLSLSQLENTAQIVLESPKHCNDPPLQDQKNYLPTSPNANAPSSSDIGIQSLSFKHMGETAVQNSLEAEPNQLDKNDQPLETLNKTSLTNVDPAKISEKTVIPCSQSDDERVSLKRGDNVDTLVAKPIEETIMEIEESNTNSPAGIANSEEEPFDHSAITLDFEEEKEEPKEEKQANSSNIKLFTKEDLNSLLREKANEYITQSPLYCSLLKRCQLIEKAIGKNKIFNQTIKKEIALAEKRLPTKPTCRTVGVNVHINQVPTRTVGVTVSIPSSMPLRQSISSSLANIGKPTMKPSILSSSAKPGAIPSKMASSSAGPNTPSTTTGVIDLTDEDASSKVTQSQNLMPMHSLVNSIPSIVQLIPSCDGSTRCTAPGTPRTTTSLRPSPNITQGGGPRVTTLLVPQVPGQNPHLQTILLRMNGPLSSTTVPASGPSSIVSSRSGTGNQTHVVLSGLYQPAANQPMHILKNSPHPSLAQTTATVSTNLQPTPSLLRHPAPLPRSPLYTEKPGFKLVPPKPQLNLSKVPNGIVLSWTMKVTTFHETIQTYELYAYQETGQPPSTSLWKKVGDVRALPLPMACTLTQFVEGNKYHFAVRGRDSLGRFGPFSDPANILLAKESATPVS